MNVELLFDHYFKFLSTKTEIYKSDFNPINLDGLEALKGQIPGTWLEIWLNRIEIFVIWRTSQQLFKLHSHISVLWHFCRFSVISEFSFLGIGLKTKTRNSRKIFIFGSIKFKWMWICVSITISTFWALKLKQTKKKQTQFNKSRGVRFSWKTTIWHTISKVAELFWQQCHLNNISRVLEITFSYFNILGFLMNFLDFRVNVMGYRAQNENPEITENLCL